MTARNVNDNSAIPLIGIFAGYRIISWRNIGIRNVSIQPRFRKYNTVTT